MAAYMGSRLKIGLCIMKRSLVWLTNASIIMCQSDGERKGSQERKNGTPEAAPKTIVKIIKSKGDERLYVPPRVEMSTTHSPPVVRDFPRVAGSFLPLRVGRGVSIHPAAQEGKKEGASFIPIGLELPITQGKGVLKAPSLHEKRMFEQVETATRVLRKRQKRDYNPMLEEWDHDDDTNYNPEELHEHNDEDDLPVSDTRTRFPESDCSSDEEEDVRIERNAKKDFRRQEMLGTGDQPDQFEPDDNDHKWERIYIAKLNMSSAKYIHGKQRMPVEVVKLLEEGKPLPGKWKCYESSTAGVYKIGLRKNNDPVAEKSQDNYTTQTY